MNDFKDLTDDELETCTSSLLPEPSSETKNAIKDALKPSKDTQKILKDLLGGSKETKETVASVTAEYKE